jgi:lipopolysaccharide biosynthesis regulator YciM
MTRAPLTMDDLERRVMLPNGKPDLPGTAVWFEQLAADPQPDDEMSAAQLLVIAGDFWALADDQDRALVVLRRAVTDGGECVPDVRCSLLTGLLRAGHQHEAAELEAELRAARLRSPLVYEYVGEAYEEHGDLATATRWLTTGLLRAIRDDDVPDHEVQLLMQSRSRVRAAQGLPPDDFDEAAWDS